MSYLEGRFHLDSFDEQKDILIAILNEQGFESFVEEDPDLLAYIQSDIYNKEEIEEALTAFEILKGVSFQTNEIPKENWNQKWESNYDPIYIDSFCQVYAPFHDKKSGFKYDILLEPKMSFGTGHHATTQLMVKSMSPLDLSNYQVLDMGSGTGILAILASLMGAEKVQAVDNDEWAYLNMQENVERNNVDVSCYHSDGTFLEETNEKFDLILANINRNVLQSDVPKYVKRLNKGGTIILSGFNLEDKEAIKSIDPLKNNFLLKTELELENWVAITFTSL